MPAATTRLPENLSKFLAARGLITGETVSDQIRQAVEEWADRQDTASLYEAHRALIAEQEKALDVLENLKPKVTTSRESAGSGRSF